MIINHKKNNYADRLSTPDNEFIKCKKLWKIKCDLDVCAEISNTKCFWYYNKKHNGLKQPWGGYNIWCNPPHSQTKAWVIKAFYEWKTSNINILMLLPINTMTSNYFKQFALPYIQFKRKMILNRINFLDYKTQKPSKFNSVNGYVSVFFKKRRSK